MPAREGSEFFTRNRDGDNRWIEAYRDNFEYNETEGGAAAAFEKARIDRAAAQARTGPTMQVDGQSIAFERDARGQQAQLADALRAQAYGAGPNPALAQLRDGAAAAQANQRSMAASEGGYNRAAASRAASFQGAQIDAQTGQQARTLQAQQMAFGRDAYANYSEALRGQDLAFRDSLIQQADRQARLEDAQRAQNDAMSQFYLSEEGRIRRGQSAANQNFQAQDAANKLGYAQRAASAKAYNTADNARAADVAVSGASAMAGAAASYATAPSAPQPKQAAEPEKPKRKKDHENPWETYDD